MSATSRSIRQPAEWTPHRAVWTAWPSHADLWGDDEVLVAQDEFEGLVRAIHDEGRGEDLEILVRTEADEAAVKRRLADLRVRTHRVLYGDIWCRDTLPIFMARAGELVASSFRFNGWGGKYSLPGDAELSARVATFSGRPVITRDFVLEGGAIEVDGEGTVLTTRQCLLHPNRNPSMSEREIEAAVAEAFGASKVLWLDEGLLHDHTDGHIDTLARFVRPGVVVCMAPSGDDDPNAEVLRTIERDLRAMRDAAGRALEVVTVPSPGLVLDSEGEVMPASHVNFYIANTTVVVPVYGTRFDDDVVRALEPLFPGRRVVAKRCRQILEGGGAFHCITQQEPSL